MKHVHLVGIKGVAMAALAVYLTEAGWKVTGSDVADEFPTDDELKKISVKIYQGFDAERILKIKPDVVYYTGAHGGHDNPEVQAAIAIGIPVYPHGIALGNFMKGKRQVVVSGSHGKTTTSAMIVTLLHHANVDPSYAIGCGEISSQFPAGHSGTSDWFVAEGDEYVTDPTHDQTPRFLWTQPEILVVTNIDFDHPDAYSDLQAVQYAFLELKNKSKMAIVNADDPNSRILCANEHVVTYGFSPKSDYHIAHVGVGRERMFFRLEERGVFVGEFAMKVPGNHNVSNAVAALVASHLAGVSWENLHDGLLEFTGTKRRFEKIREKNGIMFYDDYAHHPAEIEATLSAARLWYAKERIIAVFQPHTYSRTQALMSEFAHAFRDADTVILTDIYASAREHDTLGLEANVLVSETARYHTNVLYAKDRQDVTKHLSREARDGSIVIYMGAGDIYNWSRKES